MAMPRRPHTSMQAKKLFNHLLDRPAEWHHGYDLIKATGIKSGTLYPLLMRLADDALLESRWSEPVSPARIPRHRYRLTAKGRTFANELLCEAVPDRRQTQGLAS